MPPALAAPVRPILAAAPRRPGWVSGAWAARALTGPPGLGVLSSPWLAANTALDAKQALGAGLAMGAACSIANARRSGSRRRTEARLRAWHASRGELNDVYPIDELPPSQEGTWILGPMTEPGPEGDYLLRYRPHDGDPPHLLVVSPTGEGKSVMAKGPLLCYPLDWGWQVDVIDLKDASEFHPLPVHGTPQAAAALLREAFLDLKRRAKLLREVPREVLDPVSGRILQGRAATFREIPEALRAGLRMRFILIDEASLLRQDKPPPMVDSKKPTAAERVAWATYRAGQEAIAYMKAITALGRSLGIHVCILIQRPDADLLPGFLKNNVQARLLLGKAKDQETQQMVLGSSVGDLVLLGSDPTLRPPGRILAADVGGPGVRLAQGFLVHEAALLRRFPDAAGPAASLAGARDRVGPTVDGSPAAPAPSSARPAGPSADLGYLPAGPRRGTRDYVPSPGAPAGSSAPAASVPSSHASSGSGRLRGPIARAVLRVAAWRLLVGPLVAVPPPRPSGLRSAVLAKRPARCAACGATGVALDVEHWRPRVNRGSDRLRNLWLACSRCHAAKTSEEAIVRKWRRRLQPRALLARVPAWAFGFAALVVLGIVSAGRVGWERRPAPVRGPLGDATAWVFEVHGRELHGGQWLLLMLLALGATVQGGAVLFQRSGLDGLNTLDARLEMAYGGPIGAASRVRTSMFAGANMVRLVIGAMSASYLAGVILYWWW